MINYILPDNCQEYIEENGIVTGIKLGITEINPKQYIIYFVEFIDEYNSDGKTIAYCKVLNSNNEEITTLTRLAWAGDNIPFDGSVLANNDNQHVIINGFLPPEIGPLAIYIGEHNEPLSDIIYGFGLPFRHHVSFGIVFKEKSEDVLVYLPIISVN